VYSGYTRSKRRNKRIKRVWRLDANSWTQDWTFWEWVVIFGSVAAAIAITKVAGIAKYANCIRLHVIVFVCVIVRSVLPGAASISGGIDSCAVLHALTVFSAIESFLGRVRNFTVFL